MKITYVKESFHSDKKNKDFYFIRMVLLDENGQIISKSQPLIWLDKNVFDKLKI